MKTVTAISENVGSVLTEIDAYLDAKNINEVYYRTPFYPLEDVSEFAGLQSILNNMGLTLKSLSLYTIWYTPVASSLSVPYIVIPLKAYTNMNLAMHQLKEGTVVNYAAGNNMPYYMLSQTTTDSRIPLEDNTMYFINSDVVHSFQYNGAAPYYRNDFGVFLVLSVNEDLSSYFAE